MRQM